MKGVRSVHGRVIGVSEAGSVHCSGGEAMPADLVVCATGFRIVTPPIFVESAAGEVLRQAVWL